MAYAISPQDPSLTAALRRIAGDGLAKAIAALDDPAPGALHDAVHTGRKTCKKLRALARLVRPGFSDYATVNTVLRDAARPLSGLRDAAVFVETFDALAGTAPESLDPDRLAPLRAALTHARPDDPGATADAVAQFRAQLQAVADSVGDWSLKGKDAAILHAGLQTAFGQARKALKPAMKHPRGEKMHDLRKRVKVHWYHARLLGPIWPAMMDPHRDAAGALGEMLGQHHDLVAFDARLEVGDLPETSVRLIRPLMHDRMDRLEHEAFALARPLLAEPPDALADRWVSWWKIARS